MSKKLFAVVIVLLMAAIALSACSPAPAAQTDEPAAPEAPAASEAPTDEVVTFEEQPFGENLPTAPTIDIPLVVAFETFSQKFSPFFSDSGYDAAVAALTQITLLTTDRVGGIIFNAIEGETVNYNGIDYLYKGPADTKVEYDEASDTTKYTARLRVGMKFSDGKPVTADDLIFSYYTFLDPSYVGSTTLSSYDIVGLKDYQTQTTTEVFDKYAALAEGILAAGPDHVWAAGDAWTQEQQDDFWTRFNSTWTASVQSIVDYVNANYLADYGEAVMGLTPDVISGNEGIQIAFGMALWGFGEMVDGQFVASPSGNTYDLTSTFPTVEDYFNETYAAYEGDLTEFGAVEPVDAPADLLGNVNSGFIGLWGPQDESMGGEGVPNIAGIVKVDDYTVEVTVKGFSAPAVYSILGIQVSPLHYYGDAAKYDYANNMFGFDFGDLSKQESLTATPMGAGPYKFVTYDNRIVYFTANEYYYRGCPKIAEVQFKETVSSEVASAVQTGTADGGELTGSRARFEEVASYNSNGEITGDIITTSKVDNLGYGYAGINADTVNVAGEPGSDASKNLRKGLATILAVYRDVAIDSYYGEAASVINYPISNTSWAAPQPTDEDYKIAFSTDVEW